MSEKITVLLPMYNREKFIGACLESLLAQTYPNVRILVYDDASTDRSVKIVEGFVAKHPTVELLRGTENKGCGFARNRLLENCDTRIAAWQDSDDLSNIYRLEEQYKAQKESGAPLVFSNWTYLHKTPRGQEWQQRTPETPDYSNRCFGGSMIEMATAGKLLHDEGIFLGAGDWLWRLAAEKFLDPPVLIKRILYYVRVHNQRISNMKRNPRYKKEQDISNAAKAAAYKRLENGEW